MITKNCGFSAKQNYQKIYGKKSNELQINWIKLLQDILREDNLNFSAVFFCGF